MLIFLIYMTQEINDNSNIHKNIEISFDTKIEK